MPQMLVSTEIVVMTFLLSMSIIAVVISPDGQRHKQLLSSTDGLKAPRVLDYERSTNRLLVVNKWHIAFLFDVTRGQ
jgi:hypothetical protein